MARFGWIISSCLLAGACTAGPDEDGKDDTEDCPPLGDTDTLPVDSELPDGVDTDGVDTDAADTDAVDTDGVDTDTVDTAVEDSDAPILCADSDWWPGEDLDGDGVGDLPYRVMVQLDGDGEPRAPIALTVDFAARLADVGETAPIDLDSIRVVHQSCDAGFPAVPSQFADRIVALHGKIEHLSPVGDSIGTLAFEYDEDGDPDTAETLLSGQSAVFGVYFKPENGTVVAPDPAPTDLVADASGLRNSLTDATLDAAQGGMLVSLTHAGSGTLTSQTDSCCGNSMFTYHPGGWVAPMDGPADLEVLESGPVLAVVRASGSRVADPGDGPVASYDYEVLWWMWARRPEVWHGVTHEATMPSLNAHIDDATDGFRPWESRHIELVSDPVDYDTDPAGAWAAVTGLTHGWAVGAWAPPTWLTRTENPVVNTVHGGFLEEYLAILGNDLMASGVGTPIVVADGSRWFDNVGLVLLPYAGPFADARPTLDRLMAVTPEAHGPVNDRP